MGLQGSSHRSVGRFNDGSVPVFREDGKGADVGIIQAIVPADMTDLTPLVIHVLLRATRRRRRRTKEFARWGIVALKQSQPSITSSMPSIRDHFSSISKANELAVSVFTEPVMQNFHVTACVAKTNIFNK